MTSTDWRSNLTLARARLAQLEEAQLARLSGRTATKMSAGGESIEFANGATAAVDLERMIIEVRRVIARLEGRRGGAIIPTMAG